MRILTIIFLSVFCFSLSGQVASYDDLVMEADSVTKAYQPKSKNFALIRAKRGTGGLNKTSKGDSIKAFPITDIVLVFSELTPSSINNRESNNREKWENLIKTYPEFFQASTNYVSLCQCKINGDTTTFKPAQGFYVYFEGKEEPKAEEPKVAAKKEVAEEKPKAEKPEKVKKEKEAKPEKEEKVKEEKTVKAEKPKKEKPVKEEAPKKEEKVVAAEPEVVAPRAKKEGFTTPKRAKDPKACRPPCYENGDEDLFAFFKEFLPLSKKQRKNSKDLVTILRLQLNFDGSIKKPFVQGINEEFNNQVLECVKQMNNWNPAVRAGITIKSEVKMTLRYDKSTKAIKPFETNYVPRPMPNCKCVSDAEMFGE